MLMHDLLRYNQIKTRVVGAIVYDLRLSINKLRYFVHKLLSTPVKTYSYNTATIH